MRSSRDCARCNVTRHLAVWPLRLWRARAGALCDAGSACAAIRMVVCACVLAAVGMQAQEDSPSDGEGADREVPAAELQLPAIVHCGRIVSVARVTEAVDWVNLDALLVEGHLAAGTGDMEAATIERRPAPDMCFAVVEAEVAPKRSISKYDYRLRVGDEVMACLGLSVGDGPFDARRWEAATGGTVSLLFEVPANADVVSLEPGLAIPVPLRPIHAIAFSDDAREKARARKLADEDTAVEAGETTPEDAPEKEKPDEKVSGDRPEDATADEKQGAPATQTEAKPKPEPKPEPEPEPKPEPKPKPEPEAEPEADVLDF